VCVTDQCNDQRDHRGHEDNFEPDPQRSREIRIELIAEERSRKSVILRRRGARAGGWRG
jgi:hypothetical protein